MHVLLLKQAGHKSWGFQTLSDFVVPQDRLFFRKGGFPQASAYIHPQDKLTLEYCKLSKIEVHRIVICLI